MLTGTEFKLPPIKIWLHVGQNFGAAPIFAAIRWVPLASINIQKGTSNSLPLREKIGFFDLSKSESKTTQCNNKDTAYDTSVTYQVR